MGSGAFGEVFEGTAKGLSGAISNVAVKVRRCKQVFSCFINIYACLLQTLRKGATDQEKNDFLKEAQLMSQFKHEHILQLLGVCLDNDPHFIIMELMQGGDLLTYLRSSRNSSVSIADINIHY